MIQPARIRSGLLAWGALLFLATISVPLASSEARADAKATQQANTLAIADTHANTHSERSSPEEQPDLFRASTSREDILVASPQESLRYLQALTQDWSDEQVLIRRVRRERCELSYISALGIARLKNSPLTLKLEEIQARDDLTEAETARLEDLLSANVASKEEILISRAEAAWLKLRMTDRLYQEKVESALRFQEKGFGILGQPYLCQAYSIRYQRDADLLRAAGALRRHLIQLDEIWTW